MDGITNEFKPMEPGGHMGPQFGEQSARGSGVFGSPGLQEIQRRFGTEVPRGINPSSSGNGMSAGQFDATLGGQFAVQNGVASNNYDMLKYTMQRNGMTG